MTKKHLKDMSHISNKILLRWKMKKIVTCLLVFVFACVLSGSSHAASKNTAVQQNKERDIEYLLELTVTDAFVESYIKGFTRIFTDQAASEKDQNKGEMAVVLQTVREVVVNEFPALKKQFIPVYDEYFTHDEIKKLITFYKEPVGRKLIKTMPVITERGMEVGKQWGMSLSPKIEQALAKKGIY